jgi:hypothetical protein
MRYQHATPDEFCGREDQIIGFLGMRLSDLAEARAVLREVEEKGMFTRYRTRSG